jgi:hypothetical protein
MDAQEAIKILVEDTSNELFCVFEGLDETFPVEAIEVGCAGLRSYRVPSRETHIAIKVGEYLEFIKNKDEILEALKAAEHELIATEGLIATDTKSTNPDLTWQLSFTDTISTITSLIDTLGR